MCVDNKNDAKKKPACIFFWSSMLWLLSLWLSLLGCLCCSCLCFDLFCSVCLPCCCCSHHHHAFHPYNHHQKWSLHSSHFRFLEMALNRGIIFLKQNCQKLRLIKIHSNVKVLYFYNFLIRSMTRSLPFSW